jgi:hypothetical protein
MWIETRPIFIAKERNQLRRLLHDTGVWKEGEQLITTVVNDYSHMFTTEDINDTLEVLDVVPLKKIVFLTLSSVYGVVSRLFSSAET